MGDYKTLKKEIIRLYKTYSAPIDDDKQKNVNKADVKQGIEFE